MTLKSEGGLVPASMVERMARAYVKAWEAEWKALGVPAPTWEELDPRAQQATMRTFLAALREMREPTEVMAGAARAAPMPMVYVDSISGRLDLAFKTNLRAAIDAEIAAYEAGR